MSDTNPKGDQQAKGEGKGADTTAKTTTTDPKEGKGDKGKGTDLKSQLANMQAENENLRGTQRVLTQKLEKSETKLNQLVDGLRQIAGDDSSDSDKKDAKENVQAIVESLREEVTSLKSENAKAKAREVLNAQIAQLDVADNVKEYLRKEIQIDEPDEEKIKGVLSKKVESLESILSTSKDKRPEKKATTQRVGAVTANQILEGTKS